MKKIITTAILVFFISGVFAQAPNPYPKTIRVNGSADIEITPDEIYVIVSGQGIFFRDGVRSSFQKGDLLFVPAGMEHRFENFSDDFATWVIFYGKEGGEASDMLF